MAVEGPSTERKLTRDSDFGNCSKGRSLARTKQGNCHRSGLCIRHSYIDTTIYWATQYVLWDRHISIHCAALSRCPIVPRNDFKNELSRSQKVQRTSHVQYKMHTSLLNQLSSLNASNPLQMKFFDGLTLDFTSFLTWDIMHSLLLSQFARKYYCVADLTIMQNVTSRRTSLRNNHSFSHFSSEFGCVVEACKVKQLQQL